MTYKDYYEILEALRDTDPSGSRSTSAAEDERARLARRFRITGKEVARFCRLADKIYKEHGPDTSFRESRGEDLVEMLRNIISGLKENDLNTFAVVSGYVFWENEYSRKASYGRNAVKYTKARRNEIFEIFANPEN